MNQNPYSVSEQQTFGDLQSLGPNFDQQLRVMQIIAGALMIVNHLVIPSIITKTRLNQIKSQDSDGQNSELKLASLLSIYRMQLIITLAFLEGAAFFNLVSVMIEHHVISLIAAIVLLGLMAVRFPTRTKVSWWVQDRLRELQM
jgi:hypothetical protein